MSGLPGNVSSRRGLFKVAHLADGKARISISLALSFGDGDGLGIRHDPPHLCLGQALQTHACRGVVVASFPVLESAGQDDEVLVPPHAAGVEFQGGRGFQYGQHGIEFRIGPKPDLPVVTRQVFHAAGPHHSAGIDAVVRQGVPFRVEALPYCLRVPSPRFLAVEAPRG